MVTERTPEQDAALMAYAQAVEEACAKPWSIRRQRALREAIRRLVATEGYQ